VFSPVRTRRTFEEAVVQITAAIKTGALRVGDKLPAERALADRMQISRATVREAVRVLAEAGVVEVRPGVRGGTFVHSETVPAALVEQGTLLRAEEVADVLEARRLLEPQVAKLAARTARGAELDELDEIIELQRESLGDRARFLQLDLRFHLTLARATGNATLVELMTLLLDRLEVARDAAARDARDPEHALGVHERTLEAIRSRDPAQIEAAMDEHLSLLEGLWATTSADRARPAGRRRAG
jgi:GntR family transcriptional repressor for pyruvate dehydrogenase complex